MNIRAVSPDRHMELRLTRASGVAYYGEWFVAGYPHTVVEFDTFSAARDKMDALRSKGWTLH